MANNVPATDGTASAQLEQLERLALKTNRMFTVLRQDGILLSDAENILCLQVAGVLACQAMGGDPSVMLADLIQITDQLHIDLDYIRTLLQEPV